MNTRPRQWIQLLGIGLSGFLSLEMVSFQYFDIFSAQVPAAMAKPIQADGLYRCENGLVNFKSDAALEVIQAKSNELRGVIDPANQSFAWVVELKTFEGFNSALQREHFKENYLETDKFPKAVFQGNII